MCCRYSAMDLSDSTPVNHCFFKLLHAVSEFDQQLVGGLETDQACARYSISRMTQATITVITVKPRMWSQLGCWPVAIR
jgi:hypothetical protein